MYLLASVAWFPAAATKVIRAFVATQIAVCTGSLVAFVQAGPEGAGVPGPPKLMFATRIAPACAVTQSSPQRTVDQVPKPFRSNTLTAYRGAPGATPTT